MVNCALKMEVRQVRFLEVVPSAIRCLRFCEDATKPKLAVARANGSIEVVNPIYSNVNPAGTCMLLPSLPFIHRLNLAVAYWRWTDLLSGRLDSWTDGFISRVNALV